MLEGSVNRYSGMVIDPDSLPSDPGQFASQLRTALAAWKDQGLQLAWLQVPLGRAAIVPVAVEHGFVFHHADQESLMMQAQLQAEAFVPGQASHYVGAGGVVLDEQQRVLVVSERYRRDMSRPFYKLPGGYLENGEDISAAVVREVQEETGVIARFESMCAVRHRHGVNHGRSDFYFICLLRPLSQEIRIQQEEIEECLWMPVEEYLAHECTSTFNGYVVRTALNGRGLAQQTPEPAATYELLSLDDDV